MGKAMMHKTMDFMTTAEVSRMLGLSVGTIQREVDCGELKAARTRGGHRRILLSSIREYQKNHGYVEIGKNSVNTIGIFHHGNDLDPNIQKFNVGTFARLMTHPMELLEMKGSVAILFIDARSPWLHSTPTTMLKVLCQKHQVFLYNSNIVEMDNSWCNLPGVTLVQQDITAQFIEGFHLAFESLIKVHQPTSNTNVHEIEMKDDPGLVTQ
jgi:excisionase family DNA binding protein